MELFNFFRSRTSHRLRIALNLKGLQYEYRAVNLRREEHPTPEYRRLNPQGLVPALVVEGRVMTQSPAIIEWIEETWPHPPLLPRDAQGRAQVCAMAAIVGCDIHPLNNRRVLEILRKRFGCDEASVNEWCVHWIAAGFDAIETICRKTAAELASALVKDRRSRTPTWCRRSKAPAASAWTSRAGRQSWRSTATAAGPNPSVSRPRQTNWTRAEA